MIGHSLKKKIDPEENIGHKKTVLLKGKLERDYASLPNLHVLTRLNSLQNPILATKKKLFTLELTRIWKHLSCGTLVE